MATWPTTLPQRPLRSSFEDTAPNNLLRSDMETGPAKVRRRGTAKAWRVTAGYVMDTEQLFDFETFVNTTLSGGAVAFSWPHPISDEYVKARLVPNGSGLYSKKFFGDSLRWQVDIELEYWPGVPA